MINWELLFIKTKQGILILKISIEKIGNYYKLESKEIKLDITSKSSKLIKAKKEFSDFVVEILKYWKKNEKLDSMLALLEIEQENSPKIINTKNDFNQSKSSYFWKSLDYDNLIDQKHLIKQYSSFH